jgi:hypothetical protein
MPTELLYLRDASLRTFEPPSWRRTNPGGARQDGGTRVGRTDEVGRIRVVKTESKGKGNKRIRIEVVDG